MATKLNPKTIVMWLVTLAIPLLIPVTELFTDQMRLFLTITVFAILALATGVLPQAGITFMLPAAYILFGLADASLAWFPWTMPTVWMVIGSLLLVNALDSSGVLLRISYKIILMVGGSYKGLIIGLGLIGVILNVILFGNATVMLVGLAFELCTALDLEKYSKEATGLFLAAAVAGVIPPLFVYGSNVLMLEGLGEPEVGPMRIGYLDYTFFTLPLVVYYVFTLILVYFMFRTTKQINGKAYFEAKLNELGPMNLTEKKGACWIILLFVYIIACGFLGGDSTWAFILFPPLLIMPGIGCGTEDDVKRMDFSFILFVASCMSIGFVAQSLGFGALIAHLAVPVIQNASASVVVFLIYVINVILNFLLTPMAIMAGFTSTYLQIGTALGINPYVIYSIVGIGTDQILFPYEYALYMLFFSFEFIQMKDFIRYFGAKMLLCALAVPLILIPFWKITGLFFA